MIDVRRYHRAYNPRLTARAVASPVEAVVMFDWLIEVDCEKRRMDRKSYRAVCVAWR